MPVHVLPEWGQASLFSPVSAKQGQAGMRVLLRVRAAVFFPQSGDF